MFMRAGFCGVYCSPAYADNIVGTSPCGDTPATFCNNVVTAGNYGIEENDEDDLGFACTISADCPAGQFCNYAYGGGTSYCTNYVTQACTSP